MRARRRDGNLTHAVFQDTFPTWIVARHIGSGCTQSLHHIDWNLHWEAAIVNLPAVGFFALPIAKRDQRHRRGWR